MSNDADAVTVSGNLSAPRDSYKGNTDTVTDNRNVAPAVHSGKRNAPPPLACHVCQAAIGGGAVVYYRRLRTSAAYRSLTPVVYRALPARRRRPTLRFVPVCEGCKANEHFKPPAPCPWCRRRVAWQDIPWTIYGELRRTRHSPCCSAVCVRRRAKQAFQDRTRRKARPAQVCNRSMRRRTDAATCSDACRQAASRRRRQARSTPTGTPGKT
jgi:hypothetical protein